ncbi:MAG: GCN5-related N-acetyltransferase [Pseudomonadota bacterium]
MTRRGDALPFEALVDLPAEPRTSSPQVPDLQSQKRAALEARWIELTNRLLPAAARPNGWPIQLNHCFQRVLLDHACDDVWYGHIDGRPAYRHASDGILNRAVQAGEACLSGASDLASMNHQSLVWRGKSIT